MKKVIFVIAILLLYSSNSTASDLKALIQKNIQSSQRYYNEMYQRTKPQVEPITLWIHVRNESQKKIAEQINQAVIQNKINGREIVAKPVREVTEGPAKSQLRYFKVVDDKDAHSLLIYLRNFIPELVLNDLSDEFAKITWLKSGHFELWLSSELSNISSP